VPSFSKCVFSEFLPNAPKFDHTAQLAVCSTSKLHKTSDADDGDAPTTIAPNCHQQAPRTGIKYPVRGYPLTLIYIHIYIY